MTRRVRWVARVAVALGLAGAIAALLPVTLPVEDGSGTPPPDKPPQMRPVGDIRTGRSATQEFVATGTHIHALSLLFGTYRRTAHGTARVTLQARVDGQWRELATRAIDKATVEDNAYYPLTFTPQLAVTKGEPVRVTLSSDGGVGDAITWWMVQDWQPPGYALSYNGQSQGGTAYFRVSYAATSGSLASLARPIWRRVTIFLDPLWQVALALFLSLVAAVTIGLGCRIGGTRVEAQARDADD